MILECLFFTSSSFLFKENNFVFAIIINFLVIKLSYVQYHKCAIPSGVVAGVEAEPAPHRRRPSPEVPEQPSGTSSSPTCKWLRSRQTGGLKSYASECLLLKKGIKLYK